MPKIEEHSKNIPRPTKDQELFWIRHKIMEIFFSRLMFLSATSPLVLCMYKFVVLNLFLVVVVLILNSFLPAKESSVKRICASGWFVLPVGLCFRLVCATRLNGK